MWRPLAASTATFRSSRGYRLLVGLVWIGVAATLVGLLLHHARTLPVGPRGWNDSYVYLTSATRFVSHPSHLYDAAQRQLTHSSAQRAFIYPPSAFRYPGRSSGVLMGLALALKPVAALVLLIPLLRRRPMVSLIAALTFIAVNLPFLPLVGWQHGEVYLTSVLPFLLGYVIHDP